MNGFRPLRNDFASASDQNIAKFTSKKIRCFGRKVHGKLRLRGRIRSSSQSILDSNCATLRGEKGEIAKEETPKKEISLE